ncbi:MAG TPA: hypothetical protein VEA80_01650 [Vitreimonas sp.]|uniref:hypothetical protein n=1 Tax=Vitreimonas sp. TaxID=3069702 RepID=UPI002D62F353|nr:hypothetical protein [Vitreimonas sp.]HYD86154.1 hypothetical protein [Vitreimonas sp.]
MLRATLLVSALLFASATPALACRSADYALGIVFEEPAPAHLSRETFVLDVTFPGSETQGPSRLRRIVTANVRRVVRGDFAGEAVRVEIGGRTCSSPFRFGTEGLIVGHLRPTPDGDVFIPRQESVIARRRRLESR